MLFMLKRFQHDIVKNTLADSVFYMAANNLYHALDMTNTIIDRETAIRDFMSAAKEHKIDRKDAMQEEDFVPCDRIIKLANMHKLTEKHHCVVYMLFSLDY